jgi:hypothetical protein
MTTLQIKTVGSGLDRETRVLLDGSDVGMVVAKVELTVLPDQTRANVCLLEPDLDVSVDDNVTVWKACANCMRELSTPPQPSWGERVGAILAASGVDEERIDDAGRLARSLRALLREAET